MPTSPFPFASKPKKQPTKKPTRPFNIHHFLRDVKIILVDVGGIVVIAILVWQEVTLALASKH